MWELWVARRAGRVVDRAGAWRIFFDVDRERARIAVTEVARRTTTTYRKR